MKPALVFTLLVVAVMALALPVRDAHGQGAVSFGLRPATTSDGDATGGAYFAYTLQAGRSLEDSAAVVNSGEEPVNLKLYAADGITAINGSTTFSGKDERPSGVRSWLSAEVSELSLMPGETVTAPFKLRVPSDAKPGDHVAGWVVEAPPKAGAGGGVGASVVERVGVAVVVRVPGRAQEQLVLGTVCLNQHTGSNYFEVAVRNSGNILTRGSGALTLLSENGEEVLSVPAELGTVVPYDSTLLRLDSPIYPDPGSYVAAISMRQTDGRLVVARSAIEIDEEGVNGCQSVAGVEEPGTRSDVNTSGEPGGGGPPWITIGLGLLVLLPFALLVRRRRRTESALYDFLADDERPWSPRRPQ